MTRDLTWTWALWLNKYLSSKKTKQSSAQYRLVTEAYDHTGMIRAAFGPEPERDLQVNA